MPETQTPPRAIALPRLEGRRVGVVGLGIEGVDIVRFLHARSVAAILVSEARPPERLVEAREALRGIPFTLQAGGNDPALAAQVDVLFVSQGVPDRLPLLEAARARGVPITSMMHWFLRACPAPVVGVTGSAGKTTTTALVGEIFRAAERPVLVGGNIGTGLLSQLDGITPEQTVVAEISHTQLVRTDVSPRLAAVLSVTPNHLDQFPWDAYVALKRNLVRHQGPDDLVVLNADDPVALSLRADTPARPFYFGRGPLPGPGATVRDGRLVWNDGSGHRAVAPVSALRLRGPHNVLNALAAVAIGGAWGLTRAAMATAIAQFTGVAHRLEDVAVVDGVLYVDDSIATTPERTRAALLSYERPIVLLLGGRDKNLPIDALAAEAARRARAVICFGEAGALFAGQLRAAWAGRAAAPALAETSTLAEAVPAARRSARDGDVVLLAPAGTSFDAYDNYAERGRHFAALVRALTAEAAPGPSQTGADRHGTR